MKKLIYYLSVAVMLHLPMIAEAQKTISRSSKPKNEQTTNTKTTKHKNEHTTSFRPTSCIVS